MTTMKSRKLVAAAALTLSAVPGWAQGVADGPGRNPTQGELALLPPFCQDAQTINGWSQFGRESPRSPMWVAKLGRGFWSIHHYCWARNAVYRAKAAGVSEYEHDYFLRSAISDMSYVIQNSDPDMVLLPEIYYLIGDYYRQLRRSGEAIEPFEKSIELKADYWPPYAGLADVWMQIGQNGKARTVLEKGLAVMPNQAALTSRLKKISTAPPPRAQTLDPTPAQPPAPASAASTEESTSDKP